MSDYKPSSIVASLCKKLNAVPVAEVIRLDGTVVIVVADGRKLTFFKDDITRTLTMPDSFPLEAMTADGDMVFESKPEKVRKPRGRKEKEQHAE